MKAGRKKALDMLVEGIGGELVFGPVKGSKEGLHKLVGESKNPVIRHNAFRPRSKRKVKL